jgi:hypothetical protein
VVLAGEPHTSDLEMVFVVAWTTRSSWPLAVPQRTVGAVEVAELHNKLNTS